MELEHHEDGGVLVVTLLEKRLDARSAPGFRDKISDLIDAGHQRIALDIAQVEFIDSSGLGALVSLLKRVAEHGDLIVCGARETVMSMFKLTRLDKVFQLVARPQDAMAALAK